MKVSEVDIEIIYKLLKSVPEGMELEGIDLKEGYTLKLRAGTDEIRAVEKEQSLNELTQILKEYKELDKKGKNYLLKV